jgi:hypothetical protein
MHFVGIFVVMLLVVSKNDSSVFEGFIVCQFIHPLHKRSVTTVHIARSLTKDTLKLKCTHLFNLCSSILFIIVTQLTDCAPRNFVSHLYRVRFCIECRIYIIKSLFFDIQMRTNVLLWAR